MAKLLKGAPVAAALNEKLAGQVAELEKNNVTAALAILRVGARGDDIAYEKSAEKRCESVGVKVRKFIFDETVTQGQLLDAIHEINGDPSLHGCLVLRPLPRHLDARAVCAALDPAKDVDGITWSSLAGVFADTGEGYPPCTAQACIEMLDYYGIDLEGKKAAVIGRSLVVGKPVAMMLLDRHATVAVCHTRTLDMPSVCRSSQVLIVAAGQADVVDKECFSPDQIVIDLGINVDGEGKLRGDVEFAVAEPIVGAITPVPGGVGGVTTSVMVKHVVQAAIKAAEGKNEYA